MHNLFLEKNYVPADLKKIDICTKGNIYLVNEALIELQKMCIDMKKENLSIRAISAYRDYNYQLNLYNKYGNIDETLDLDISVPLFSNNGKYLCVAEKSGQKIYLISNKTILWQKEVSGNIEDISVNEN